ncbi:MAG TPA: glycosyltransferase, partial [Humisphaera sp.]|nr:glycosyltransferase [Humisphaera sp.]
FGMPAIEALACGCPLVCSDTPALREVAGKNALYFPPGDLDALCARLRQILSDASLRARLIEDGYGIAGRFTWEAAGRRMLDIFADAGARFTFGYAGHEKTQPRPRIGVLLAHAHGSPEIAATIQSLIATRYDNLVVGVVGKESFEQAVAQASRLCPESEKHSRDGCATHNPEVVRVSTDTGNELKALTDFARQANLDLVGQMAAGNRLRPSGLDSLAGSLAENPSSGVHLGEVIVWRGDRYRGIARLRYTGDDMWRIEKLLYPEMFFLSPAALAKWPAGQAIIDNGAEDWRWKLLLAARVENQLAIVRRTLADCDRSSLPRLAWIKAFRAGMLDFHRLDNRPSPVPILRRFERRIRMLSQLLPQSVQHLGTKWWYRLTRSRHATAHHE